MKFINLLFLGILLLLTCTMSVNIKKSINNAKEIDNYDNLLEEDEQEDIQMGMEKKKKIGLEKKKKDIIEIQMGMEKKKKKDMAAPPVHY